MFPSNLAHRAEWGPSLQIQRMVASCCVIDEQSIVESRSRESKVGSYLGQGMGSPVF